MKIICISLFPEVFWSFLDTSLIQKARDAGHITIQLIDPRQYCTDKHQQVDDEPYGWWAWLVIKAPPIIEAIKTATAHQVGKRVAVIMVKPSQTVFVQKTAHTFAEEYDCLVFVCGRYEWIDHRVCLRWREQFGQDRYEVSIGQFVTLGGELPAMTMIEAIVRLVPWVIKEQESRQNESYRPEQGGTMLEHPHYTRPQDVEGFLVPEVLLSGNHAAIEQRRVENMSTSTTSPL